MKEEQDFKKYFETGDNYQKEEKRKLFEYCLVLETLTKFIHSCIRSGDSSGECN